MTLATVNPISAGLGVVCLFCALVAACFFVLAFDMLRFRQYVPAAFMLFCAALAAAFASFAVIR